MASSPSNPLTLATINSLVDLPVLLSPERERERERDEIFFTRASMQ